MRIIRNDGTAEDVGPMASRQIADLHTKLYLAHKAKRTWRLAFCALAGFAVTHMIGHLA